MSDCFDHLNDAMDARYGESDGESDGGPQKRYSGPRCCHCGVSGWWHRAGTSWCLYVGSKAHVCHVRIANDFEDLDA